MQRNTLLTVLIYLEGLNTQDLTLWTLFIIFVEKKYMEFQTIADWCKWLEKPIFSKITNQVDVVFNDAEPIIL